MRKKNNHFIKSFMRAIVIFLPLSRENLSIFSMNNAGELNLLIRNSKLVDDFLKIADWRKSVSMKVDKLKTLKSYNKIIAFLQELHQKLKL